ncbi:MAG: fibronectin type III domain-containing protein [Ignavibacteria bacterium]
MNDSTLLGTDSVKSVSGLNALTWYYWRLNSKSANGTSLWSGTWKFKTLGSPTQVSLFSPPNNSVNQPVNITFNWFKAVDQFLNKINLDKENRSLGPQNVSKYWFELSSDSLFTNIIVRDSTLTDTINFVSGLNNLTNYYWRVRARNEVGWGSYSAWFKFTTIISAPAAPVLVSPTDGSLGQNVSLTLVWNKLPTAASYRVQVAMDSLFTGLIVNDSTLTDSTRAISGLNPLTYYWWRVNAKNIGGTSSYSVVWKFKTIGFPVQVTLLNPANNAVNQPTSITFLWSRATEPTQSFTQPLMPISKEPLSRILVSKNVSGKLSDGVDAVSNYWFDMVTDTVSLANLVRDTTLNDTAKSLSGLSNLTSYYWRVKAKGQIGWGNYSVWFKFTTIISTPSAPLLVSPANGSLGQNLSLTLVWIKLPSAASYRVQVATDSLFAGLIVNDSTLTDSIKAISGLNPLTYYWWRVNAKNIGGTSSYSAVWKFKTIGLPGQVTLLNPPNNAANQPISINFSWSRAVEQTSPFESIKKSGEYSDGLDAVSNYWFDMVTDTVSLVNLVRDTTLTDTTKTVSGLSYLTSYYWRVKAKGSLGWGNYSIWFKFTTIISTPAAPVLVSPPNGAAGQPVSLTLIWHPSPDATSYRVQLSADSLFGSFFVNDSTVTDTTRAVSGLSYLTKYYWKVNAKNIGGTSNFSAIWNFTTGPLPPALVNLKVIPGGFYNTGIAQLNMKDTIRMILVDSANCTIVDSARALIDSLTFSAIPTPSFANVNTGKYYILIFHRNHLPIASRYTQQVTRGSTVSYDFTADSSMTYGFNMIKVSTSPVLWGMIPADANQDEYIDALDQVIWINQNGENGIFSADFNGDTYVDALDQFIWILYNGNSAYLPCGFIPSNPVMQKKNIDSSIYWMKVIRQNQVKQNNSNK